MNLRCEKLLVALLLGTVLPVAFMCVSIHERPLCLAPPAWLVTPLDRLLPLVPQSVWVYVSWYPATAAIGWGSAATFRNGYKAYIVAFFVCVLGYLAFPVSIPRPVVDGAGASDAALRLLYALDPPVNVFPSFHAAVATIILRLRPTRRALSWGVAAWAFLVCAACVLTKQHYVLDVVAGVAVGALSLSAVEVVGHRNGEPAVRTERAPTPSWREELRT